MKSNPKKLRKNKKPTININETIPIEEEDNMKAQIKNNYVANTQNVKTTSNSNNFILSENNINDLNVSQITNCNLSKNISKNFGEEYFDEIYINLLFDEKKFDEKINPNYMTFQISINYKMRAVLVDWLIEIHYKLNFLEKTLFQCIFIIDLFLSKNIIDVKYLQLLGIASLLIACKENEIIYPNLYNFVKLTNNAYSVEDLTEMERNIMKSLKFDILSPTAEEFFELNAEFFKFSEKQNFFGKYLLECSLIDHNFLKYKQSTIAITCGYITMKFFKLEGVQLILENTNFNIKPSIIKICAKELCTLAINLSKSSLEAVKNKYMSEKFLRVAELFEI